MNFIFTAFPQFLVDTTSLCFRQHIAASETTCQSPEAKRQDYCPELICVLMWCADTFIQKTKKLYADTRTQRNIDRLNADISEVHSIMTRNIQDVLGHGERLDREPYFLPSAVVWNNPDLHDAYRMRLYAPALSLLQQHEESCMHDLMVHHSRSGFQPLWVLQCLSLKDARERRLAIATCVWRPPVD